MKEPSAIALSFLLVATVCRGQEENPFVKRAREKPVTEVSGESFVGLVEHILVPPEVLDAWLKEYPMKDDAAELRKAADGWIAEGIAVLDETALTTGLVGVPSSNHAVFEQIYATEVLPPEVGEWPFPTGFEKRELGYSFDSLATEVEGTMVLQADVFFTRMLSSAGWSELVESTRQPDDILTPNFRAIRVHQSPSLAVGAVVDPFASPPKLPFDNSGPGFLPDQIHLITRANDEVAGNESKITGPQRLIFYRGSAAKLSEKHHPAISGNYLLSAKIIRVEHATFSTWLNRSLLADVSSGAESVVGEWKAAGKAEDLVNLMGTQLAGSKTILENVKQVIYPTEWQQGKIGAGSNGNVGERDFSSGTSFETTNTGAELQAEINADSNGPILSYLFSRVIPNGESIHHRIQRGGEWVADIKFPVFFENRWNSSLRVERGKWLLVGSGAAIDANGKFDPSHVDLAFIKVE